MKKLQKVVIDKEFSSAGKLLDFLSPTRDSLGQGNWVYRGHANATWGVLPSLFRTPKNPPLERIYNSCLKYYRSKGIDDEWESYSLPDRHLVAQLTCLVEKRLLRNFSERANMIGLTVPEIEKILNKPKDILPNFPYYITMDPPSYKPKGQYYKEFLLDDNNRPGIYAGLAQHHGVPTRLLDFTFNAMKAIYFAITPDSPSDVCIWAVNTDYFERDRYSPWEDLIFESQGVNMISQHSVLRMPSSTNLFLHHQQGVFIYPDLPYDFYFCHNRYPTFIDHLDFLATNPFDGYPSKSFGEYAYKLTLRAEHYHTLKKLIQKLGVTLSSVMPTYDSVAEEIKMEADFVW